MDFLCQLGKEVDHENEMKNIINIGEIVSKVMFARAVFHGPNYLENETPVKFVKGHLQKHCFYGP